MTVIDGMSLADAMAKSPETFPRVYVAMVKRETGGFLDVVLAQIADFRRAKRKPFKVVTACFIHHLVGLGGSSDLSPGLLYPKIQAIFSRIWGGVAGDPQIIVGISELFAFTVCKSRAAWR